MISDNLKDVAVVISEASTIEGGFKDALVEVLLVIAGQAERMEATQVPHSARRQIDDADGNVVPLNNMR